METLKSNWGLENWRGSWDIKRAVVNVVGIDSIVIVVVLGIGCVGVEESKSGESGGVEVRGKRRRGRGKRRRGGAVARLSELVVVELVVVGVGVMMVVVVVARGGGGRSGVGGLEGERGCWGCGGRREGMVDVVRMRTRVRELLRELVV